jgi:hypothetical protein
MAWLKDAYLDILVLILILAFAFYTNNIFEVVIWVYTGLLLLSKILVFFMPSLKRKANQTNVPPIFHHIIYALTVIIFLYIGKYFFTGAWLIIWITSTFNSPSADKKGKQ